MGVLCLSLFWYALVCVLSSFPIFLKRKRELDALLLLSYGCLVTVCSVALHYGAVGWSAVCDCGISGSYSLTFLFCCRLLNTHSYTLYIHAFYSGWQTHFNKVTKVCCIF